ncbi:TPA: hypothetical protein BOS_19411 [Bos taurus]|nr:TPA: hypothetical protein BOS_19411 [Bos taurus]
MSSGDSSIIGDRPDLEAFQTSFKDKLTVTQTVLDDRALTGSQDEDSIVYDIPPASVRSTVRTDAQTSACPPGDLPGHFPGETWYCHHPEGKPEKTNQNLLVGVTHAPPRVSLCRHFTKHARLCPEWQGLHLLPHCGLLMDVPEHFGYGMFPDSAKRMESGATNEFHVVPPFLNVPPVCLEPWLQVADAAEPLKRKEAWLRKTATSGFAQGPGPSLQPIVTRPSSRGRWAPRGRGAPGGGSKLVIGHLQELRIHVPDALSLGVEQELVVAAVRTDRWAEETASLRVESNAAQDALVGGNVHWRLLGAGQVHKLHVACVHAREGQETHFTLPGPYSQNLGASTPRAHALTQLGDPRPAYVTLPQTGSTDTDPAVPASGSSSNGLPKRTLRTDAMPLPGLERGAVPHHAGFQKGEKGHLTKSRAEESGCHPTKEKQCEFGGIFYDNQQKSRRRAARCRAGCRAEGSWCRGIHRASAPHAAPGGRPLGSVWPAPTLPRPEAKGPQPARAAREPRSAEQSNHGLPGPGGTPRASRLRGGGAASEEGGSTRLGGGA